MKFGKTYPLYQAFLTYRSLEAKKSPRAELDKAGAESASSKITLQNLFVAYDLEQLWTADDIDLLTEELVSVSEEDKVAILRFYTGLRRNIMTLKEDSPVWPTAATRAGSAGTAATTPAATETVAPPAPDAYWHVWDPQTQKTLVVYAQYGPALAYDAATCTWVPVRSDFMVLNGRTWAPLKSVSFFANI